MFECKLCEDSHERFKTIEGLYSHLERKHNDEIPPDWSVEQFAYYLKTGKKHGTCVICKGKTKFNPKTGKYYRLCENPKCKEKNREIFEKRMIGKYGKVSLLDDPEQQKKMLANRSISGEYTWSDGTKKTYTGSYEYDFLRFLDVLMDYPSRDVITPSPHTYYYEYEGKKHFYIPDVYIESLNLEIEIKDGGDNPNTHHKIQDVDKVKERLKDQVLLSQTSVSYIKITNKSYDTFMKYLMELKDQYNKLDRREKFTPIFILAENYNEEILGEIVTEADENTDYTDGVSDETEMNTGNDSSSVYYACDTTGLKTIKPTKDANGNECIYASPFKEYAATKGLKLNNSQLSISSKVGEEISMNVKLLDKEANVDRVFSVYELNGDGFTPVTTNGKESKTVYMKKGHAEVIREFKIKNYRKYIKRFPNVKCEDFPTDKQIKEKEAAKESVNIENTLEATNLSYSNSFEDVKEIVDSLSKKDLNKICNGTFKESPNTIYREVILRDGEPAAFIEVYNLKTEYPDADGCIVVAVKEKYRGMGLTKKLVHRMLEDKKFKWTHLIWETAKTNKASIAIANQLKFKKTSTNEENIEFSIYRTKRNAKESFDLLDALLYSHKLAQGMEFLTEEMRDASAEEQKSVMENIKSISEPTGISFYDEVEEASRRNDLHGISPNKKFYILPFFEMMNPKNWGQTPMYNGKFKEARPRIMKKISWCKSQDDIKYLLRDASYGINQLTKLRNDLDYALKNPDDKKSKYEELRKRNKKGLTVESIDEHIKWIKEEYREAIYDKRDELKAVKESLETVEEGKITDDRNGKVIHTDNIHLEKEYGINVNGKYQPIAKVKGFNFKCRGRSELLVIKGNSVYLAKDKEGLYGNYSVPGGGWDATEPHDVSASREAEEEARLSTKNVQYGGNYLTEYPEPHKWVQEKIPKKEQWRGYYTEVYIGEYTGKFNGHIDEEDKDDIINVGKFYPISEVQDILNPVHRRIIDAYIQQRDMMKKAPSHLYRVTYEDDGIYEVFRKNATFEEWKAFKESKAAKWLPIPTNYGDSDVSYFTEEGFKKFRELTLPSIERKLDTDKIIATKVNVPNGKITYYDKYQYVIEPEKAIESLETVEENKIVDAIKGTINSTINNKLKNRGNKNSETVKNSSEYTIKKASGGDFEHLYNTEAFCGEGLRKTDGNIERLVNDISRIKGHPNTIHFYYCTGKDMNTTYHLTTDNRYPDDLEILFIDWSNFGRGFSASKHKGNFRYFSDVVDNNARREIRKNNPHYKNYHSLYGDEWFYNTI